MSSLEGLIACFNERESMVSRGRNTSSKKPTFQLVISFGRAFPNVIPPPPTTLMATRAYHIVSHYEPPEDHKSDSDEDVDEGWSKGHTFGLSKRLLHPPKFVRPSGAYDEYGRPVVQEDDDEIQFIEHRPVNHGSWYKNLSRANSAPDTIATIPAANPSTASPPKPSNPPHSDGSPWFISTVVQKTHSAHLSSSTAIGDMLKRDPPPLSSETPFIPPVFTILGPTNRGYSMLEKDGWQEGEALGPGRSRRSAVRVKLELDDQDNTSLDVVAVHSAKGKEKETIDLTLSSEEDEDYAEDDAQREALSGTSDLPSETLSTSKTVSAHSGRALLTPLPTVLKADKSGIGSTKGASRKITQTSEAIQLLAQNARGRRRKPYDGPQLISQGGAKAIIRRTKKDQRDRAALLRDLKS